MKKTLLIILGLCILAVAVYYGRTLNLADKLNINSAPLESSNSVETRTHFEFEDAEYTLDRTQSRVTWTGSTFVHDESGTIRFQEGILTREFGRMNGVIILDMKTISANSGEKLNDDLKSSNFFDIEKHPLGRIDVTDYRDGLVYADMTLRGNTHPVQFPITVVAETESIFLVTGNLTIDRTLWGIHYRSSSIFDGVGNEAINDDIDLEVNLVFYKQ